MIFQMPSISARPARLLLLATLITSSAIAQTSLPLPPTAGSAAKTVAAPKSPAPPKPQSLPNLIASALRRERLLVGRTELQLSKLRNLYKLRANEPVFMTPEGPTELANELKSMIAHARARGLNPINYWSREIDPRWASSQNNDQLAQVELELLLTNALIRFAIDSTTGRIDPQTEFGTVRLSAKESPFSDPSEIKFVKRQFGTAAYESLNALLNKKSGLDEGLAELEPQAGDYKALKALAEKFLKLQTDGQWKPITLVQKVLRPGAQDAAVPLIRSRLATLGYLPELEATNTSPVYDPTLVRAVKIFQFNTKQAFSVDRVQVATEEKPLPPSEDQSPKALAYRADIPPADGVIGPKMLAELNMSLDARLDKIAVNLEKWRWLPREIGARYFFVNTARQELRVFENDQIALEMNVVVGKILRRTPSMLTSLNGLVINPTWTAPVRNIVADILPALAQDPEHFDKENLVVLRADGSVVKNAATAINWSVFNETNPPPYQFVQLAGVKSSLGNVKFNLDNPDSIYMHDWAYDHEHISKFYATERFASSGCVRLSRPHELLMYVLREFPEAAAATYLAAIDKALTEVPASERQNRRIESYQVNMPKAIPVVIANMTASFDKDGLIQFAPDYYGQDEMILNGLQ